MGLTVILLCLNYSHQKLPGLLRRNAKPISRVSPSEDEQMELGIEEFSCSTACELSALHARTPGLGLGFAKKAGLNDSEIRVKDCTAWFISSTDWHAQFTNKHCTGWHNVNWRRHCAIIRYAYSWDDSLWLEWMNAHSSCIWLRLWGLPCSLRSNPAQIKPDQKLQKTI